jgi:hypothetical protein
MSKELIEQAIELGIENAESLTVPQLKKAIIAAVAKWNAFHDLRHKAVTLGIEIEGKTDDQLSEEIQTAEAVLEASKALRNKADELKIDHQDISDENLAIIVQYAEEFKKAANEEARETEVSAMLSDFLGVPDVYDLSKEEIKSLLDKKATEEAAGIEVVVEKSELGKINESFAIGGKDYVFTEDAPGAFRYLGVLRTQKEWSEDADALELMVAGKLSFLTLKK